MLGPFYGALTEANDAIDAVWQSLPQKYRSRVGKGMKHTPQLKLEDLWRHWDKVDLQDAIKNLVWQQVIDFAVGQFNRRGNQLYFEGFERLGIEGPLVGPGFGGAQRRYLTEGSTRGIQETTYVRRPETTPQRRIPRTTVDALFYR